MKTMGLGVIAVSFIVMMQGCAYLTVEGPAGYSCPSAGILVGSA